MVVFLNSVESEHRTPEDWKHLNAWLLGGDAKTTCSKFFGPSSISSTKWYHRVSIDTVTRKKSPEKSFKHCILVIFTCCPNTHCSNLHTCSFLLVPITYHSLTQLLGFSEPNITHYLQPALGCLYQHILISYYNTVFRDWLVRSPKRKKLQFSFDTC